jgi:hypothetical protein
VLAVADALDQPPQFPPGFGNAAVEGLAEAFVADAPAQPAVSGRPLVNAAVAVVTSIRHKPLARISAAHSSTI